MVLDMSSALRTLSGHCRACRFCHRTRAHCYDTAFAAWGDQASP